MSDPVEYYSDICCACKHCFYTGLPGAYACELKEFPAFTDPMGSCEKYEEIDHDQSEQIYMRDER